MSRKPEISVFKGKPSDYVKLNVGGYLFQTTVATLTKQKDTMLAAMFTGHIEVLTDPEGWILIDRCGKHFGIILNLLRDGSVPLPKLKQDISALLEEAKYYCIKELEELCCRNDVLYKENISQIIVDSERELNLLINATTKPIVILALNDYKFLVHEQAFKSILFFDKLSVCFQGRNIFIKHIRIGETCDLKWLFYFQGIKQADIPIYRNAYFKEAEILKEIMKWDAK